LKPFQFLEFEVVLRCDVSDLTAGLLLLEGRQTKRIH
jgi:hypothetical protein